MVEDVVAHDAIVAEVGERRGHHAAALQQPAHDVTAASRVPHRGQLRYWRTHVSSQ